MVEILRRIDPRVLEGAALACTDTTDEGSKHTRPPLTLCTVHVIFTQTRGE
jgi:hypothetical protein